MRNPLPLLATILSITTSSYGQSVFVGVPGSAFLDNVADSTRANISSPEQAYGINPFVDRTREETFLTKRRFALTYAFLEAVPKPSGSTTYFHDVTANIYLEASDGFSLDANLIYGHFYNDFSDRDDYKVVVQPGYDLLRLFPGSARTTPRRTQLILATALGYDHGELTTTGLSRDLGSDTYTVAPSLTLVHAFNERLIGSLTASHNVVWYTDSFDANSQVFMLNARGDYQLCSHLTGVLFATWKHDVQQDVNGASQKLRDWAEFGGSVRYAVAGNVQIKVGYSYEAFAADFESHIVVAGALVSF